MESSTAPYVVDASKEAVAAPKEAPPAPDYLGPPVIGDDGKVRVGLQFPLDVKKFSLPTPVLSVITLRPITVRDRRLSIKTAGVDADDMDRELSLLGIISSLPGEVLDLIDHRDYGRVQQAMGKLFFSTPPSPSNS